MSTSVISADNAAPARWSVPEVFRAICETESAQDLLQYKVDGWCVWTYLRPRVAGTLISGLAKPHRMSLSRRALLSLADMPGFLFPPRRRILVKTCTSGLLESEAGKYKDIWFADLLKRLDSFCIIESMNNVKLLPRRKHAMFKRAMTLTLLESCAAGLSMLDRSPELSRMGEALSGKLRAAFGEVFSSDWVVKRLRYFRWLRRMHLRVLKHVKPGILLVANNGECPLIAAARDLGICVFEFQHGINDSHHPSYIWTDYALPYKKQMPLPDRMMLYGEYWKEVMDASGFWGDALRPVGSARMDDYRGRRKRDHAPEGPISIVLTTQGHGTDGLIEWIAKFMEISQRDSSFKLIVKLHPVFDPDPAPYLSRLGSYSNIEVQTAQQGPSTFELLSRAALHLSISSATHYDALALGVPSVILAFPMHEIVLPLHEAGHALLARTPEELASIAARARELRVPEEVQRYYFTPGALDNVQREIQSILDGTPTSTKEAALA